MPGFLLQGLCISCSFCLEHLSPDTSAAHRLIPFSLSQLECKLQEGKAFIVGIYVFVGEKTGAKKWKRNQEAGAWSKIKIHGWEDLAIETGTANPVRILDVIA